MVVWPMSLLPLVGHLELVHGSHSNFKIIGVGWHLPHMTWEETSHHVQSTVKRSRTLALHVTHLALGLHAHGWEPANHN